MGRGNVCTTGPYEGVFYIDNDDLRVYRRNDPHAKEEETSLQRDLSYEDLSGDEWLLDEVGSSYEEEDVLECFCAELRKLCPSFQPAANSNVWLGNERRVILENELFYIDSMKKALLARLPSIGIRTGAWTSGTITREEAGVC